MDFQHKGPALPMRGGWLVVQEAYEYGDDESVQEDG